MTDNDITEAARRLGGRRRRTLTACIECGESFPAMLGRDGTAKQVYCSTNCRSKAWQKAQRRKAKEQP